MLSRNVVAMTLLVAGTACLASGCFRAQSTSVQVAQAPAMDITVVRSMIAARYGFMRGYNIIDGSLVRSTRLLSGNGRVSFDPTAAVSLNHEDLPTHRPAPNPVVCGVPNAQYLGEFASGSPDFEHPKVPFEWADNVFPIPYPYRPSDEYRPRGMYFSGSLVRLETSAADILVAHPFGTDIDLDVDLDSEFLELLANPDSLLDGKHQLFHVELEQGLWPHRRDGSLWFTPKSGDAIAAYGPWIMDCGHPDDYHTEVHPLTFVAFSRLDSTASGITAWAFVNPYWVSQFYVDDSATAVNFTESGRLGSGDAKSLPQFVAAQLGSNSFKFSPLSQQLHAFPVIVPTHFDQIQWFVCPPIPPSVEHDRTAWTITVEASFTKRSNVPARVRANPEIGCAEVVASLTEFYKPRAILPTVGEWSWDKIEKDVGNIDVRAILLKKGGALPTFRAHVNQNPKILRLSPLVISMDSTKRTDDDQPFPFYGIIHVRWTPVSKSILK
jgi:hypothetical protein